MKTFLNLVVVMLVFLAVSSGVTKVMLRPQDVEFFGAFGFTNALLIAFGAIQLLGGILLAIRKSRILGSLVVAVTFLLSAALLAVAGNIPVAVVTVVCIALLGFVIQQTRNSEHVQTDALNT